MLCRYFLEWIIMFKMDENVVEYARENLIMAIEKALVNSDEFKDLSEVVPVFNAILKGVLLLNSIIAVRRFKTFLVTMNFSLDGDLVTYLKKVNRRDVIEFLVDSSRRSIEEKSEIVKAALAIHTGKVIKENRTSILDIKIFRSLKDLSDLEIRALLKYLDLVETDEKKSSAFVYKPKYDSLISEVLEIPASDVHSFMVELFYQLKGLNLLSSGGITYKSEGDKSYIIGASLEHFKDVTLLFRQAKSSLD